ncbi:MAG: hypothetical protein LBT60_03515 [Oscillospiraceae bacterium]|nr:hypothetical protein [Oscillospiraceae bacterium]
MGAFVVSALAGALGLTVYGGSEEALGRAVTGGYAGDLLSWVMGRAPGGAAWVTIMSNVNVAAVAVMADLPCVVLAEGVAPDEALQARALRENVALLGSPLGTYELCHRLHGLLTEGG